MKIEDSADVIVADIDDGVVFAYNCTIYIKTDIRDGAYEDGDYRCVRLCDGCSKAFNGGEYVRIVNAKVVIE